MKKKDVAKKMGNKEHEHVYISTGRTHKGSNEDVGGCIHCRARKNIPAENHPGPHGRYTEKGGYEHKK